MNRDKTVPLRSSPLKLREQVLRRNAEALNDPDLRVILLKLADQWAKNESLADTSLSDRMITVRSIKDLETASTFMDEALRLLDAHDFALPASKLAEAIEELNLVIVRVRRLAPAHDQDG